MTPGASSPSGNGLRSIKGSASGQHIDHGHTDVNEHRTAINKPIPRCMAVKRVADRRPISVIPILFRLVALLRG